MIFKHCDRLFIAEQTCMMDFLFTLYYIFIKHIRDKVFKQDFACFEGTDQKENYNWCRFCRQGWVATKIIAPLRIYQRFRYTINLVGEPYILCPFFCSRTTSITRKGLVMVVNSMFENGLSQCSIIFSSCNATYINVKFYLNYNFIFTSYWISVSEWLNDIIWK